MRRVSKGEEPPVLASNRVKWEAAFAAAPTSRSRFKYRHPEIKNALYDETSSKCVYCESKVGHNTPGDVEHLVATSLDPTQHFVWANLTVACSECNRRKGPYNIVLDPFLNPYADEVEDRLVHFGPIMCAAAGDVDAEITVRVLELNKGRDKLFLRKIEKIDEISNLNARIQETTDATLKAALELDLQRRSDASAEYSGMVRSLKWK